MEQQKQIIEIIMVRLDKEQDGDAKAMMILLVEKCSRYPNVNALAVLTHLLAEVIKQLILQLFVSTDIK